MRDHLGHSVGPWWRSGFSMWPGVVPGLRPPTRRAPGPLGNSLGTPAKAQYFCIITIGTTPTLTTVSIPTLIPPSLPVGHLCDSHHEGHGHIMGGTKAKGEWVSLFWCHPQPHPPPCRSGQEGILAYSLLGSRMKTWVLARVLPHPVGRVFLCSPSWQTPCRPGLWHRPWGGACWVFCGGSP